MCPSSRALRIELLQIDPSNLRRLAAAEPIDLGSIATPQGSIPPYKVVARALTQWDAGTPAVWCLPYLIVADSRDVLFGACGFKSAPVAGSVEISYGIAPSFRGRGIATLAVQKLLHIAACHGAIQVVAHILPDNAASTKVVQRAGFARGPHCIDSDGEEVVRWTWRK